ncbi:MULTISPECIES: PIN domain-containing protein [Fischerella]|uniref:PIN domain-containing protein n=1 Tax=Fischerella muscicola CCMEE 5323 TaxID=2019572 RepID=A0A2N6JWS1_FISMU|nr:MULTISPECIES: PIN domain-containing protein [Fischerella]MBD2431970.1 PIN domain-containing protein [Fischerella sp. FACHB-380]PLZ84605.1 PIN domain-containing protein [Fischerella muscicola CCMEE 5323]
MTAVPSFIDTNVWLYRLLNYKKIEEIERERKRNIAISITSYEGIIISTQVVNEISANLLKKAAFKQEQIKAVIQSLYRRCTVVEFNLNIFECASDIRSQYNFSFWDSLIVACALRAGASILYSEDMQDQLVVAGQLEIVNPFK